MSSLKDNVLRVAELFPEETKKYNSLVSLYWKLVDGVESVDDIPNATPAESISRYYRMLVREGKIKLDTYSEERRAELEQEWRREAVECR